MTYIEAKISHAWQWAVVMASFFIGLEHFSGAAFSDWDPSLSSRNLPWPLSALLGLMMVAGALLTGSAIRKKYNPFQRWQKEHAGLALLGITWAVQTVTALLLDPYLMVPWTAYICITVGCYFRLRQSKRERRKVIKATEMLEGQHLHG